MSVPLDAVALMVDSTLGTIGAGNSQLALVGDGLQGLLGLVFAVSGAVKLVGVDEMVENFERWGYPQWFRLVTGLVEVTGALVLVGGLVVPVATAIGGAVLGVTMLGAIYTHVHVDDPLSETAKPATLLVVVAVVVVL